MMKERRSLFPAFGSPQQSDSKSDAKAPILSVGTRTIRAGLRHLVDRKDRRDLFIFQVGFRYIERRLTNSLPVSITLCFFR